MAAGVQRLADLLDALEEGLVLGLFLLAIIFYGDEP